MNQVKNANPPKLFKLCEQFVLDVYKTFQFQPQKLKGFVNLFSQSKKAASQLVESQMQLVELIQDFPDLVEQLNKLVPEDFKVPKLETDNNEMQEETSELEIQTAIQELQARRPDKVIELIKLIKEVQENRNLKNIEGPIERLRALLMDEDPNLYNMFEKYYRKLWNENSVYREEAPEMIVETSNQISGRIEPEAQDEYKSRPLVKPYEAKKFRGGRRGPGGRADFKNSMPAAGLSERIDASTLPPTIRNELYLFEYLRNNLDYESYDDLMKLIYLYSECVLSANEVFMMTRHLFYENENYFSFFCDIINTREITRRRNTTILKPLGEIDFNKLECDRNGSYTKVPDFFPHMKRPIHAYNPNAFKILNKTWISVPQGSEVNFQIKAKNIYEENLFRCEDERYEFDTLIYNCTTGVKWLNNLENLESEAKLATYVERILRLKIIQKIYGNNSEVIEIFKKTPVAVAKILADRISTKLREIQETKYNQARKKWHETAQENFHRSLDHRSFYFKQYEKKLTYHKNFNTDALDRFKDLNILGNIENLRKYWSILNTFDGISNGVSCKYQEPQDDKIFDIIKKNPFPRRNLPIFRMTFSNRRISQDIFDILLLRIQSFHANSTEKEKINRYLRIFMLEILKLPYETGKTFDVVLDIPTFIGIVTRIETKIYDKSFSSGSSKVEDSSKSKDSVQETLFTAIDRARQPNKDDRRRDNDGDGQGSSLGNRRIDEELLPKKNPTESLEDELLRLDSGSEDQTNIREMEFASDNNSNKITSEFLPQARKGQILFYGTQHVYHLFRFYFTLYERFLKAFEISREFESNPKANLLSKEEKDRIAEERYESFKWILVHLLRSNIESEKYEDMLRSIFGNKAYLMFYIEKILHMIIITIQKLANDEITTKSLSLYPECDAFAKILDPNAKSNNSRNKNLVENVYLSQLNHLTLRNLNCLQSTSFFRFLHDPQTSTMTANLYNSPYKDWTAQALSDAAIYTKSDANSITQGNSLSNSQNPVFLRRAKEKNRKKTVRTLIKIVQKSTIEWKYVPNTLKLVTDSFHQEDFILVVKRKKSPSQELMKQFITQNQRINRFKAWSKTALQNLNSKTS